MKEQRETLMSYLVTLGFIIFILLFLSSLVFLSRMVLSQDSEFGTYVSSTQDLLKEIDKVQREVNNISLEKNDVYLEFPSSITVLDVSSLSQQSGKSYLTFTIDRPTFRYNSTFYYVPNSSQDFKEGDLVLLNSNKSFYVMRSESTLLFYDRNQNMFDEGNFDEIRGVVLYENR